MCRVVAENCLTELVLPQSSGGHRSCDRPCLALELVDAQLRISGPCLCLEESMEEQDEKPQGSLKACMQESLLPQEIIIKVEGEDARSLAVPSQTRQLHLEEENRD